MWRLFALILAIPSATYGQTVVIETHDGRQLTGQVDSRTSSAAVWLRREDGPVRLTTAIDWTNIRAANVDGQTIEIAEVQPSLAALASEASPYFLWQGREPQPIDRPLERRRPIVDSVVVDAVPASWDHDVELDGLLVRVACLDAAGQIVPAEATVELRLMGERMDSTRRVVGPVELERWTAALRVDHFAGTAAELRLPYHHIDPEHDMRIGAEAELTGTVGIMGQGSVAFSSPVVLQSFSPLRDRWQLRSGSRVLPGER